MKTEPVELTPMCTYGCNWEIANEICPEHGLPKFHAGGVVESTGLAMAHHGDHVVKKYNILETAINNVFFKSGGSRKRHIFHVLKRKKTFPCKYCMKNYEFKFTPPDTASDSYENETSKTNTD